VASELKKGLPVLTSLLKQEGLIEEVNRTNTFKAVGPYRFHWPSGKLVDKYGGQLTLYPRHERVIREMLEKDPLNPTGFKTDLNYNEVALKYVEGWAIEKAENMDETELRAWIAEKGSQIREDPTPLAHLFASDFRRTLKSHGIIDRDAIIKCDKKNKLYRLTRENWHEKRVLDHSEPSITYRE
jgi:hypothetical protein